MKTNNGKLVAAIAIIAMIACCLTVVSFDSVDAEPATAFDPASGGVITVNTDGVNLAENTTITDRLAINGTLTVPAGVTLTINYNFDTSGESIITFGNTGCLDVQGTVIINANNVDDSTYTSPSNNHVFNTSSTTYANDTIKVSGNLTINETTAVKGVLNYGNLSMVVTSGNVVINGNGMSTTYIQQSGGNVDITLNDGSVSAYVDITGGSFTVGGENQTNSDSAIFTPYAMHVGNGASFTANGKVGIYSGSATSAIKDNANLVIKKLDVDKGASVTVGTNGSIDVPSGSTFTNDGDMNLYGTVTGTVNNSGTIRLLSENASATGAIGTGSIDSSAISNEGTISGTYGDDETGTNTFDVATNQIVTVTDDLTLVNSFQINVMGTLVIPEGVTVTIRDTAGINLNSQAANVENNGTIIIESTSTTTSGSAKGGISINSGILTNEGTVTGQYLAVEDDNYAIHNVMAVSTNGTFQNNGTVTIGSESGIDAVGKFVNDADATLALNGKANGAIQNSGIVNVNLVSGTVTISLAAENAVVNANSVTGTVKVDDKLLASEDIENSDSYSQFNISSTNAVRGITISSVIVTEDEKDYKTLQITGTAVASGDSASGSVRAFGNYLVITDTFSIGKGITLHIGDNASSNAVATNLYVTGDMTIVEGASISFQAANSVNPYIYVSGSITSAYNLMRTGNNVTGTPNMNAVAYSIDGTEGTTYYYTSLTDALASTATTVTVYGKVDVVVDTEITSGKTVAQDAGSIIKIAEGVTLSAVDGAKITQAGQSSIEVQGTLYLANERNILRNGNITADVKSTDGTDARYTNLANAINLAENGDTIKLYTSPVTVSSPLTIREGVTVDTDGKKLVINGTTVTVNGTLFINGTTSNSLEVKDGTQEANIIVNGYIKSVNLIAFDENSWTPSGAYYSSVENGSRFYYITTATNGIANVNTAYDGVTMNGTVSLGTVTIAGTEDADAIVNIAGTATGNITLDAAVLNVTGALTGSVTDGNGTVTLPANSSYANAKFSVVADEDDIVSFIVSGEITACTDRTISVTGEVTFADATVNDMTVDGTVTIDGTVNISDLLVNGTVNVANEAYLYVNKTGEVATILGDLNVAEASDVAGGAGSADFDSIYVGIDMENPAIGVSATVNGNVTADNTYVASSATVPESLVKEDSTIDFYVEGTLWITFYGTSAVVDNAPVQNALFLGWNADADAEEPSISKADAANGISPSSVTEGDLYAIVEYKIYNVTVVTDGGVASVAIDGNILAQGSNTGTVQGSNVFVITGLTAGEHKLTYTLKAGFEGTPTMTIDGQAISGDTFTLSGNPEGTNTDVDVTINLAGTQPATGGSTAINNGDDGLGLTDYLLIILVVLIVIMAIMVAMRLMRS